MRLNGVPGLRATAAALPGHHPPRVRLAAGPFVFSLDPEEALALADQLVDAVDTIRHHRPERAEHR